MSQVPAGAIGGLDALSTAALAGINEVVIADHYPDKMAIGFLKEAKVKLRKVNLKR